MVRRIAFHRVSSHQTRGLEHFADRCNIPWNLPTIFHPSLTATMQQTFLLFTLRTALSAIPFVSDLCGVDVQWFQERSSQALPNSDELSVYMTFGFSDGSRNFLKLFSVSWEVICFAQIRLSPFSGKILYHDCVSMIVSRFTFLVEDFLICCYQSHQTSLLEVLNF